MRLPKYSLGIGDRFGHQGVAQLDAVIEAGRQGVALAPVWNKSYREHAIVLSTPAEVRAEADQAVSARGWTGPYFVDADHVGLQTVDEFLDSSDFFTLDVADQIGTPPDDHELVRFLRRQGKYVGRMEIPGTGRQLEIAPQALESAARRFLAAVKQAGRIYRHIREAKGADAFVTEVSLDETDQPQTPVELLVVLAALADQEIPAQTIAPRFTGRLGKGVDYVGDLEQFTAEFEQDLGVIAWAVGEFGLPRNLKLSIHSGSDKFSIYGPMYRALRKSNAGVHLKTAGTTWLEELIGLAAADGDGLQIAKEIYNVALKRRDELCDPYASVVDIDPGKLPSPAAVAAWSGETFAAALRHDSACKCYNPSFRQLLHVSYKVAAEMGGRFVAALEKHADVIARNVTENLYRRHIAPLFLGQ